MKISAVLYAIVIVAFFMPFFVVRCQQTELMTIKGVELVTGADVKLSMGDMLGGGAKKEGAEDQTQKVPAQPLAQAALLLAVVALILVLVLPKKLFIIPLLISVGGIVCLQLLNQGMLGALANSNTALDPSMDLSKFISIQTKLGYWLANVFFLLGGLVATGLALLKKDEDQYTSMQQYEPIPALNSLDELEPLPTAEPLDDLEPLPTAEPRHSIEALPDETLINEQLSDEYPFTKIVLDEEDK
ncbi:MAG: hypothetical protein RBS43_07370 [Candidatus Cloacimonas sp.]|nr:hypothetical protein [Candidatus Cloacimonas sp.]